MASRLTLGVALDFGSRLRSLNEQLKRQSALLEPAEAAGFEMVAAGESGSPGAFHLPNALLVLATLAQRTRLRLVTGIALLPNWPVRKLAIDSAELDQLSGGRLTLGVGLGSSTLQASAGWPRDAVGEIVDETLSALRQLWSGAAEYAGTHVSVSGALPILPVNNGRLPIWVGGAIRRSAVRAARLGDGWYGGVNFPLSRLATQAQTYRTALGDGAAAGAVVVNRVALVAATRRDVDDLVQRLLASSLQSYARPGQSLADVIDDVALIGTPDQVAAQLQRYQHAGATHVFVRLSLDDTPPDVARTTIDLFGSEIIPRLAPVA
jgi:alkanesulfonate monooxygenase SsuD/methylene tetrahydromethanopterin reductase-like flavin-dependent oxidoreductase (luciferase family)